MENQNALDNDLESSRPLQRVQILDGPASSSQGTLQPQQSILALEAGNETFLFAASRNELIGVLRTLLAELDPSPEHQILEQLCDMNKGIQYILEVMPRRLSDEEREQFHEQMKQFDEQVKRSPLGK